MGEVDVNYSNHSMYMETLVLNVYENVLLDRFIYLFKLLHWNTMKVVCSNCKIKEFQVTKMYNMCRFF